MTRLFHPPFSATPATLRPHPEYPPATFRSVARVLDADGATVCELPWSGDIDRDSRRARAIATAMNFAYPADKKPRPPEPCARYLIA